MPGIQLNSMDTIESEQTFIMLPKASWDKLVSDLEEIKDLIRNKAREEADSGWIESTAARKMLGVSHATWQSYRDMGVIPFSQFGRKIYVRRTDIEAFLESHIIRRHHG